MFFRRYFHIHAGAIIALLIIGLVGFLSVYWFRSNYLIAAIDFSMPLNRIRSALANFYVWDSRSLGSANPRILAFTFPVWLFFAFSEIIGLSVSGTEIVLFYLVFTFSGLSMYYLTTTLIGNKASKPKHLAGLISGIFYMLNPYVAINIMPIRQVSYIIYALLPLVFALFIKGLNEKRIAKPAMITAFSLLSVTSIYVDPSFIPLTFLPLLIYLIFFILTNLNKTAISSAFKFTTIFVAIWTLLNLYWLIPNIYSSSNELAKVASSYSSVGMSFQSTVQLNSAPILGAIRLIGYWALNSGYKGDPYFVWAPVYQTPLFVVIGFLIPLLAFVPILLKPKDKNVIFFTIFAIISLLLMNGSISPVGDWIYSGIPLLGALFNTPYLRFGMYLTLAYAFLIGYVLARLFDYLSSHIKRTNILTRHVVSGFPIVLILFLIVGVYAFPLWTGDVIRPDATVLKSNQYQIPVYYQTASDWLRADQSDFKILVLPISAIGYAELTWPNGGYDGPYPAEWLFPKPVISSTGAGNGKAGIAAQLAINNQTVAASKILALMDVKYILFHEDANWLYIQDNPSWISISPEQITSILGSSNAFSLEREFGELHFYRNNNWRPMHISAASNGVLLDGDLNQTTRIIEKNDFNPENSVLLFSDQLDSGQVSELPLYTVIIPPQRSFNSTFGTISNSLREDRIVYPVDSQPTKLSTPNSGNYLLATKVATGYGYGNLSIKIDNQLFIIDTHSQEQEAASIYKYVGPIHLAAGNHTISISEEDTLIPVYDGVANPINWTSTFTNQVSVARYNPEWKAIIRTDGSEPWDALSFPSTDQSPYTFPLNFTSWNAYNSTLAYLVAGDTPFRIDEIWTDGNITQDITGVWWETDWMGMTTKSITFPIIIPPNQKAIIQINHKANTVILKTNPPQIENMLLYSLKNGENFADANNLLSPNQTDTPSITYEEINPTKYVVHVDASKPFFLVFSEFYDKDWIATIDGQQVPNEYHFTANGFANGWYINKTGTYTITLEFWPQNLFYAGSAISITTLIICALYVSKDKIKIMFQKIVRSKISRKD